MRRILIIAVLVSVIPPFIFNQTTVLEVSGNTAGANAPTNNTQSNRQDSYPGKTWAKAKSPEELGWSSERLKQARQLAGSFDTAAVMIVDDGIVVDEWGETDKKFNVHSTQFEALVKLILAAKRSIRN